MRRRTVCSFKCAGTDYLTSVTSRGTQWTSHTNMVIDFLKGTNKKGLAAKATQQLAISL